MFPTTQLSLFDRYQRGGDERHRAVSDWYLRYHAPMRRFVAHRFPSLARQADDVVEEFIIRKVLPEQQERSILAVYAPRPGKRFRAFLQAALRNYCLDTLKQRNRKGARFALEEEFDAPCLPDTDEFEVLWARQVVGRAIRRTRAACLADPKLWSVWGILESRFLRPFRGRTAIDYPELVERFGFKSTGHAQKAATAGKTLLREALLSVVSEYAGNDDAEFELMDLWRLMRRIREVRKTPESRTEPE
jgi:DNA-directed RNA polymerase specialized sigma24 family protein